MTSLPHAEKVVPDVPDAELVARAARGDQAAFERIMRRHNRTLFRTARAILRNDEEAEDALQEGYLQAYGAMAGFRGDAKLSTWLARIVANQALQRLRKRERRAEILPLQSTGESEPGLEESAQMKSDQGPEAAAQSSELRRVLEAQIDTLPDSYRAVFMLRAVEELSVEETAEVLGIAPATVRSRHFRARSLLREALALKIDLACEDAFAFAGERCDRVVAFVLDHLVTQEKT